MIKNVTAGTLGRTHQLALVSRGVLDIRFRTPGGYVRLTINSGRVTLTQEKC